MERLTGWTAFEVVGRNKELGLYDDPDQLGLRRFRARPLYQENIPSVGRSTTATLAINVRNGGHLETEVLLTPVGPDGDRLAVEVQRIVARVASRPEKPSSGATDPLTRLPGPERFKEVLADVVARATRTSTPLSLLMVDVDHMGDLAERFGSGAADDILCRVGGILRAMIRESDVIARVKTDGFALLLEGTGRGDARHAGGRIRKTIEHFSFDSSGRRVDMRVTVSVGVASCPADGESSQELLHRGVEALHEAHRLGRNRVWCYARRPRMTLDVPVYFDGPAGHLLGWTRDLSHSGLALDTSEELRLGMRCGLSFRIPGEDDSVHLVGRVARVIGDEYETGRSGVGIEFERFGEDDRDRIERFLHPV